MFADFLDRKANNNPTNFAFFEKGKSIVFVKNLQFIELLLVCKIDQGKLSGAPRGVRGVYTKKNRGENRDWKHGPEMGSQK